MKDLRIIVASVFLLYLGVIALPVSADDDRVVQTGTGYRSDDDRYEHMSPRAKEALKKLYEQKKKKEEEKKKKKPKSGTGVTLPPAPKPVTNTGTTSTGTTGTTTTTTPVTKTATVNYNVPDGNVPVAFTITVSNGTITAASSRTLVGGTSGYYQDAFARSVSAAVVGKKASTLSLSAVGGASLTTIAFTNYVRSNF